ncbi:MAG TPA: hypothetical protein VE988_05635 [Gemmataceae bacterium]|nr:hypothetical protein [Gemmataceae bacterium]
MDKDKLLKNHFWILAIVAAVLALASWVLVLVTGPSSAAGDSVKTKNNWKGWKNAKDFKHPGWIEEMRKEAEGLKSDGASIHGKLYAQQTAATDLMSWPKTLKTSGFDMKEGKFAFEIEVHPPKTSLKSLPPDTETKHSGKLIGSSQEYFDIEDSKNNPVRFLRSIVPKVIDKQDPNKKFERNFGPLGSFEGRMVTVSYVKGKFFGIEEFTETEKDKYREHYHKQQLSDALAELKPLNDADKPTILFRYVRDPRLGPVDPKKKDEFKVDSEVWIYEKDRLPPHDNRFFPYVKAWSNNPKEITSEEIWAAQEDIWVRRELFKQLKAANDVLAHFEPVMIDKKTAKPNSFHNFYWEIDFALSDEGVSATLKNLRPHEQAIDGLHFILRFKDKDGKPGAPVLFPPKERPLKDNPVAPAGGAKSTFTTKKPITVGDGSATEIFSVDQVLTVETAAVKRIDVVAVGTGANGDMAVSQRQSTKALFPFDKSKQKPAPTPVDVDPNDPNAPPPLPPDTTGRMSRYGFPLDRYLELPTAESRKLPVNLVLVVGPEHISLVQASLVSSPLRFFPTQVLWQRCQLTLPGPDLAKPFAAGGKTQENFELSVYGVVTIYQRPGRPSFANLAK